MANVSSSKGNIRPTGTKVISFQPHGTTIEDAEIAAEVTGSIIEEEDPDDEDSFSIMMADNVYTSSSRAVVVEIT